MDRKHLRPTVCQVSSARVFAEDEGASALVEIAVFDRLQPADAAGLLRPCCASRRWTGEMVLGRPYGPSMRRVLSASDDIIADLSWADLAEALAAHPRITDAVSGADRKSAWSRQEQYAAAPAATVAERMVHGKLAYEARFGHAFLTCATGRSAAELLSRLQQRLTNPTLAERAVVRDELRAVVRLRLIKTLH